MKMRNVPEYAGLCDYIVYRQVENNAWFYGAYNDKQKANQAAIDIDGYVTEARNVEPV